MNFNRRPLVKSKKKKNSCKYHLKMKKDFYERNIQSPRCASEIKRTTIRNQWTNRPRDAETKRI